MSSTLQKPPHTGAAAVCPQYRKSIELSLILTGGLGLLLPLQAGAHVMLSLLDLGNDAFLGAAALESAKSAFQRFVLFHANFRH